MDAPLQPKDKELFPKNKEKQTNEKIPNNCNFFIHR